MTRRKAFVSGRARPRLSAYQRSSTPPTAPARTPERLSAFHTCVARPRCPGAARQRVQDPRRRPNCAERLHPFPRTGAGTRLRRQVRGIHGGSPGTRTMGHLRNSTGLRRSGGVQVEAGECIHQRANGESYTYERSAGASATQPEPQAPTIVKANTGRPRARTPLPQRLGQSAPPAPRCARRSRPARKTARHAACSRPAS
jgi:hypothetical protein